MRRAYHAIDFLNAACTGNLEIVRGYLAANINNPAALNITTTAIGMNALMLAISSGHNEIALALLEARGLDINASDRRGKTALMQAASGTSDNFIIVKTILRSPELNVNARDENGWTALMFAVNCSHIKCVAVLLQDLRVDLSIQDNAQRTALDMSPYNYERHQIIMRMFENPVFARQVFLLDTGPVQQRTSAQAFLDAARDGNQELVESYIRENQGQPTLIAECREAAQLAEAEGQGALAAFIMQLMSTSEVVPPQAVHAQPESPQEMDDNSFQARLARIDFNLENLPERFLDQVTNILMQDPVTISSGMTLDRSTLKKLEKPVCPFTCKKIHKYEFSNGTNQYIKEDIENFIKEQETLYAAAKVAEAAKRAAEAEPSDRKKAIKARLQIFGATAQPVSLGNNPDKSPPSSPRPKQKSGNGE